MNALETVLLQEEMKKNISALAELLGVTDVEIYEAIKTWVKEGQKTE